MAPRGPEGGPKREGRATWSTGCDQFVEVALLAVAALLPIVDPSGRRADLSRADARRRRPAAREPLAKLVALDSFLLLLASALFGTYVLDFFGLSIPDVQLAGGIVVCALGWSLLNKQDTPETLPRAAAAETATVAISRTRVLSVDDAGDRRPGFDFRGAHARRASREQRGFIVHGRARAARSAY